MKTILSILLTVFLFSSLHAQRNFYHELKGIEDSTGHTHLFFKKTNNIYHFAEQTGTDSVLFKNSTSLWWTYSNFYDYAFLNNDPSKWYAIYNRQTEFNTLGDINAYNGSFFDAGTHWANSIEVAEADSFAYAALNFSEKSIIVILKNDSLPSKTYDYHYLVKMAGTLPDTDCEAGQDDCFLGKSDSVLIHNHNVLSIDRHNSSHLFFQRNDTLFHSEDLGKTKHPVNSEFTWSTFGPFSYSSTDSILLAATKNKYSLTTPNIPSFGVDTLHTYQLLRSSDGGQSWNEIFSDTSKIYITHSFSDTEAFYYAAVNNVFVSKNQGESFSHFITVDDTVTGIYKKPDSNILYVLTKEELLKVNTETKVPTTLKRILSSNEQELTQIPSKVSLAPNYPNPFNPSTVISYHLAANSLVRLEVFDVTGRKVAVLVDGEPQMAGVHQIIFDAYELSSGVYFYRLQSGGQILTRKMLLVK